MTVSPPTVESRRAPVKRLVTALIATLSLVLGPLAFAPSQAAPAFTISGTVTGEDAGALTEVTVTLDVYNATSEAFETPVETETDDAGAYSFANVAGGMTYRVTVDDAETFVSAAPVEFVLNGDKKVSFNLVLAGSISGFVKDLGTGLPINEADVTIFRMNGTTVDLGDGIEEATDEDGAFHVSGLLPGNYKVKFEDYDGNHLPTYYKNSSTLAGAATVLVNKGADSPLGDISMFVGSKFTGSVVDAAGAPIADASVQALPLVRGEADYDNAVDAVIEANGNYAISGLSAGAYKVQFSGDADVHLDEFYNNQPTEETADVLSLGTAATRSLGRTVLEAPAGLTGVVKNKAKKKIDGVTVELFKVNGGVLAKAATDETYTEDDGTFEFEELFAGTYRLKLTDDEGRYKSRFSSDVTVVGGSIRSAGVIELTEVPKKAATVKVVGKGGKKKVTLTITVKASGVTPTGKVTIKLGTKKLKTVNLKKGKATVTLTKQKKGKRAYKIIYSGDAKVLTKTVASKKITIK